MFKRMISSSSSFSFRKIKHYSSSNKNMFETKIISKECIKPSRPTPSHLKTLKLSFLDQYSLSTYVQLVLFYRVSNGSPSRVVSDDHVVDVDGRESKERSNLLKHSLSQTLNLFYPLAGKIADNLTIDCNDEGVHYAESRVGTTMSNFLSQPDNAAIQKFLPSNIPSLGESLTGAPVASVQANVFECGSVAVGFSFNHKVFDGVGLSAFVKSWSDIARGGSAGHDPDFTTSPSLFPQNEAFPKGFSIMEMVYPFFKPGKSVTNRFVFDSAALAKLKVKATSGIVQKPTRFEVVTALIWKCAVAACRANSSGIQKPSLVMLTVNMRPKTELPISNNTMGNAITVILPHAKADADTSNLDMFVHEIREAKKTLRRDALKDFEGEKGFDTFCEDLKKTGEVFSNNRGGDSMTVTSWLNFGMYEVDFGWGKPAWVASSILDQNESPSILNIALLNDTKHGNGIEAWVSLDEQDMSLFQCNEEILEFSSLDPSPLVHGGDQ